MAPANELADGVARAEHTDDDNGRGDKRCAANLLELIKAELQAEGEEQKDNADFRPGADIRVISNRGEEVEIRAGDEAGNDVAEDERLINFFEQNRRDAGNEQYHRQVTDDCGQMGHGQSSFTINFCQNAQTWCII